MDWSFFKKKPLPPSSTKPEPSHQEEEHDKTTSGPDISVPISYLKRLIPVGQYLDDAALKQLKIKSGQFKPGMVIFSSGKETNSIVYLVSGEAYLEVNNGNAQMVSSETMKALYPLSSERFHHLTAIAKSQVTVIYLPRTLLRQTQSTNQLPAKLKINEALGQNAFAHQFMDNLTQGKLNIPNLPDIAVKIRQADTDTIGIAEFVKLINLDPVIAAKLIQVVNSPVYRPVSPITNCLDAVNRLGISATRNLITALTMKNLIRSRTPLMKKRIQEAWVQSVKVSSLSYILAKLINKVDPEEALLAGLVHNIGILPILIYADSLPAESYLISELDEAIPEIQGQLGAYMLEKWQFPDSLKTVPVRTENWFNNFNDSLDINDVIVLAKFHNILASQKKGELPLINTLPAFQKLEKKILSPDLSLQILLDAKQQINDTMKLFTA
jgi:HD-like signal output (HDOD) protein